MGLKNRCYAVAVCKTDSIDSDLKNKKFRLVKNGIDFWAADPFPIEIEGTLYIFGELYEYKTLKGVIGYTKLTDNGFAPWKKIIEEPYHLSFPNIFRMDGQLYMCPESGAGNVLMLYRCEKFPDVWVKDRIIADNVQLTDTVFVEKNGERYGIACDWKSLKNHTLKLFRVDDDGITFSDKEPELLEQSMSRPGGKVFFDEREEKYLLPAQICRPKYGSGLIFKEISLDFPLYSETEIKRVYPADITCDIKKKWDGMHTFNVSQNYIVIDMIWSRFNIIEKIYRLLNKIGKKIK